jgi:Cutinase
MGGDAGSPAAGADGVYPRRQGPLRAFADRIRDYCGARDPICQSGSFNFIAHAGYVWNYAAQLEAVNFVAGKVRAWGLSCGSGVRICLFDRRSRGTASLGVPGRRRNPAAVAMSARRPRREPRSRPPGARRVDPARRAGRDTGFGGQGTLSPPPATRRGSGLLGGHVAAEAAGADPVGRSVA